MTRGQFNARNYLRYPLQLQYVLSIAVKNIIIPSLEENPILTKKCAIKDVILIPGHFTQPNYPQ